MPTGRWYGNARHHHPGGATRMKTITIAALLASGAVLGACSWVNPTEGGNQVRVAYDGNVSGCRDAGSISVSVADKVAFYHRSDLTVRDELETLARNQAAGIPADTIKPTSEPKDGGQQFQAYVCGRVAVRQRAADPRTADAPPPLEEAQTHAIKDH